MSLLARLAAVRGIAWYVALLGSSLAMAFAFLIYPAIDAAEHAVLDPDLHGPLGFGIWKLHTFSYYPDPALSAARGPLYPLLIAGLLAMTDGWWPYSVQLAQCVSFGVVCVMVFWTAKTLWNAQLAVLAAMLCALDPFLIWYQSRVWVEPLMMVLFTALVAAVVRVKRRPSVAGAVLVGLLVGASVMTKSVYSPFVLLTPLLLLLPYGRRVSLPLGLLVLAVGIAVVAPWTLRNGKVTGIYAPEVGNTGFTLHQGNDFVEDFSLAPFSVSALYPLSLKRMRAEDIDFTPGMTSVEKRNALDAGRRRNAIDKLVASPSFFIKKIGYGLVLFWTFGDSPGKSAAIATCQLPVVVLFGACLWLRRRVLAHGAGLCAALILLYYFAHLPTITLARYSSVLIPAMLAVAVGAFARDSAAPAV